MTALHDRWIRWGPRILHVATLFMALSAIAWLVYEFWRLLYQPIQIGTWKIHPGGIDLKLRYTEVHAWFAGVDVYAEFKHAAYPPASYVILWPFLGWLGPDEAVTFWAATSVPAIGGLIYLTVQGSGADNFVERAFTALIPLSMYATGAAIGNGQLITHILPVLTAGLLLVSREQNSLANDTIASFFILLALVKPSISGPFLWIILFVPGRLRPTALVAAGYITLTAVASQFQEQDTFTLFREWLTIGSRVSVDAGHSNVHNGLTALGLEAGILWASLALWLVHGVWVYWHRNTDIWILMGVSAFVARFWTYHRWYDDLLVLLPLIALFRIAKIKTTRTPNCAWAAVILAATLPVMLAPGGLYVLSPPWKGLYVMTQTLMWLTAMMYLLHWSRVEKQWAANQ